MDIFVVFALLAIAVHVVKTREQAQRIALLGGYLGQFQIEKLMQDVLNGYQRALGEADEQRQAQVWRHLEPTEQTLCEQFNRFVLEFAKVSEPQARLSRLPLALPFVAQYFPSTALDMRKLLSVHARGITQACQNRLAQTPKRKAFTLSAELMLMQHSCHWFCRSKMVASTRLLARHQTAYAQVLAALAPSTRQAYGQLIGN
ncbi:hypothetical protein [Rhodoferax sp.]|uniref:hypothetical protein n=1 Tax=Rhodoferax sp. TaxID=50421 RepID=UPI002602F981|nr:hypothetical protein [Rhodoferax sp.]MDD2918652.1 hypothetical protein [Rhodoferax sp.]